MRARPPAQRKGKKSKNVTGNVGGGEKLDLVTVGKSNND
jgi:hypothetical protein